MKSYRFPDKIINKICTVIIHGTMDANGVSTGASVISECYYEHNTRIIRSPTGENIMQLSLVVIKGDIVGLDTTNKGNVNIDGKTLKIDAVERFYNPDQSVHHIELLVK